LVVLAGGLSAGCVERRFVINSEPQGALVYVNGQYLGATPVDYYYTYYGKYEFKLVRAGYEPLTVIQPAPPPWYEWPGLDFIAENVVPYKLRDVRTFCYNLQPLQTVRPDDLLNRASGLRARGQAIGPPRQAGPAPASPGAPPAPPAGASPAGPLGPPVPGPAAAPAGGPGVTAP
jgi:hypothetical protein